MTKRIFIWAVLALLAAAPSAWAQSADQRLQDLEDRVARMEQAQPTLPTHQFHIAGYMSGMYHDSSESIGTFMSSFSPIFLYRAGDKFLFESELALGFDGDETDLDMEYAQLDYMVADKATVVAGKFLLPFGVFGERVHPSWINKLPNPPPIYGGHHGPGFDAALMPVLADFGLQVRGGIPMGGMTLNYAVYTVNGPRAEVMVEGMGHHHGGGPLTFTPTASDNNDNKAAGFRVGLIPFTGLEIGASYYGAKVQYEESAGAGVARTNSLKEAPIKLTMADLTYYTGGLRIMSEYLTEDLSQMGPYIREVDALDVVTPDGVGEPGKYTGYYAQVSYQFGNSGIEPVLRYGKTSFEGVEMGHQTAVGLDWWLGTSVAFKVAYTNDDLAGVAEPEKHYYAQVAFGF